jgi:1A family penicillin-binding protein
MPIPQLKKPEFRIREISKKIVDKIGKKPRQIRWKKILYRALIVGAIVFAVCVIGGIAAFAWFSRDLPDPNKIIDRSLAESTKIYARDETTLLYEIHGSEKRTVINLEDIPDYMKWATIAVEDKDFYKHPGFSIRRIISVTIIDVLRGRKEQGASTITQQFVKNAILSNEKSFSRKIREVVLAYQLERKFTKDQILKLYFNEIPYGSTAYGVESAAHTYFNKSAKNLTLAEAALLAALPQAPTYYSPYGNHTDALINRQHVVLNLMVDQGHITKEQADAAKAVDVLKEVSPKKDNILAPHFVMYVKELLTEKYGEKMVEQGGLKVITTLNIDKQRVAEESINDYADRNQKQYKASNAALVSLDTKTGQILAMVGSRDYFNEEIDGQVNVTLRPRQPGSSFKPFVYAAAFAKGYTPDTILFDLETTFKTASGKDYTPHNYDSKEHGPLTMRQALAGSLNIPAVKTLYLAGIDTVIDEAQKLGYTTFDDRSRFGLSLVLGGAEVKLLEHTAAYAALAREGVQHPTAAVLRVEDKDGKVLEEFKNKEEQVLDKKVAQQVTSILTDNNARAFIFGSQNHLTLPDRPVAAKTGTTNDYHDAWTMGYTPSIATGVWVGNSDNAAMSRGADGSVVAAPIWQEYMKRTVGGPVETFHTPPANNAKKPVLQGKIGSEVPVKVDKYTGKTIPSSCLATYPAEFIAEKTVREVHDILFYVDKNNPTGPEPANPASDPQYENWEAPVRRWAQQNNYLETRPPEESCSLRAEANKPVVSFKAPGNGTTINTQTFTIKVAVTAPRPIKSVVFFLDEKEIGMATKAPYALSYTAIGVENGFHDIKAVAHDDIENTGLTTTTINYLFVPPITNTNSNTNTAAPNI